MKYAKALGTFLLVTVMYLAVVYGSNLLGFSDEVSEVSDQGIWNALTVYLLIRSFEKP